MVRPLDIQACGIELLDLSYPERLALWSLRQLIGREPPRCGGRATGMSWSFDDDGDRIDAAFRRALDELDHQGIPHPRVDLCASLIVTAEEDLLLRCVARMQQECLQAGPSLETVIPARRGRDLFLTALNALAAALAACGYWLSDFAASQSCRSRPQQAAGGHPACSLSLPDGPSAPLADVLAESPRFNR